MNTNPLIGKTIASIEIAADKKTIKFVLNDGTEVIARADGDCCSNTWIEHVSLPARGFPAAVTSVADLDMPDLGQDYEYGHTAYYGCCIKTDRGDMVMDYRNESNGYYGGDLSWPGDYFYGGVYGQNVSKEDWQPITADV